MKQIEPDYDRGNQYRQKEGTLQQPTRTQAAAEAGLSEHQRVTLAALACSPPY